ncbi:hypothetical protein DSO57_1017046 [Entomophthora muscae]|uniref:Uncharacterized protein n=1 Tax=Entomophthora muscae TaxID=34485 RepID=A0ACC2SHF3_9FUNG|nr:hypothetical protein DSO57_1017046 [Entomophthora muscae]
MKEILSTPPLPSMHPIQDFSRLGSVYITVLGLTNQAVPHTESWCLLATTVNYIVRIASTVYMAFQAWPASPVGVQRTLVWAVTAALLFQHLQLLPLKEVIPEWFPD